jgi:hypothetical protein
VRLRSGAIAGLVSVVVFTWVHDLFISDIWEMLPVMAVAGGLRCVPDVELPDPGAPASPRSWAGYVGAFIAMFWLLAVASVAVFEPVTTMAEVSAAGGPIDHLFGNRDAAVHRLRAWGSPCSWSGASARDGPGWDRRWWPVPS